MWNLIRGFVALAGTVIKAICWHLAGIQSFMTSFDLDSHLCAAPLHRKKEDRCVILNVR